jgi:hypothetical protein
MRISDIMRLGKSAIIFATIVVAFLAIIWLLGYKMIYKKILHGKKGRFDGPAKVYRIDSQDDHLRQGNHS